MSEVVVLEPTSTVSIFRTKVVRHAHSCAGLVNGEDVEHAGGNLDHGH